MWEREVKQREPDQEDVGDDILARRIGKSHAERHHKDAGGAVEPGKETRDTRDDAMSPDVALQFALEISDPAIRTRAGKGSATALVSAVTLKRKWPRLLFMWSSLFQPPWFCAR